MACGNVSMIVFLFMGFSECSRLSVLLSSSYSLGQNGAHKCLLQARLTLYDATLALSPTRAMSLSSSLLFYFIHKADRSERERERELRRTWCVFAKAGAQLIFFFFFKFPPEWRNLHLSSRPNAQESSGAPPRHLFERRISQTSSMFPGERSDFQREMNRTSGSEGHSLDLCFSSFCHSSASDEWTVRNGC